MATGPEHYAEAERLLTLVDQVDWTTRHEPYRDVAIAAAQAHATLAAAAATIELAVSMQDSNGVRADWLEAVST